MTTSIKSVRVSCAASSTTDILIAGTTEEIAVKSITLTNEHATLTTTAKLEFNDGVNGNVIHDAGTIAAADGTAQGLPEDGAGNAQQINLGNSQKLQITAGGQIVIAVISYASLT